MQVKPAAWQHNTYPIQKTPHFVQVSIFTNANIDTLCLI